MDQWLRVKRIGAISSKFVPLAPPFFDPVIDCSCLLNNITLNKAAKFGSSMRRSQGCFLSTSLPVRLNVNAAVIKDDELLMIEFHDENGIHFNLPGGGLEPGESVEEGLRRECREEASVDITVDRLLLIWEYVPEKENFKYGHRQKVGLVFLCSLKGDEIPKLPDSPDKNQTGVRWIKLSDLANVPVPLRPPIFPAIERPLLEALKNGGGPTHIWREKM